MRIYFITNRNKFFNKLIAIAFTLSIEKRYKLSNEIKRIDKLFSDMRGLCQNMIKETFINLCHFNMKKPENIIHTITHESLHYTILNHSGLTEEEIKRIKDYQHEYIVNLITDFLEDKW